MVVPLVAGLLAAPGETQEWPPSIRNLQVLDRDSTAETVIDVMRGFTNGLDVRCEHCHVGVAGAPLSTFDFASDEREAKRVARQMMRLTRSINDDLQKLNESFPERHATHRIQVDCTTCHRGRLRPEKLTDIVTRIALDEGVPAATAKYRQLRDDYHGRSAYDFGESSLLLAARKVEAAGERQKAIELLQLNLEMHPEASWTLRTLGQMHEDAGDVAAALATWRRVLARSPESERAQSTVARLERALERE